MQDRACEAEAYCKFKETFEIQFPEMNLALILAEINSICNAVIVLAICTVSSLLSCHSLVSNSNHVI